MMLPDVAVTLVEVVVAALIVILSAAACYLHYVHRKYAHIPGPKRTSFWLGNIPEISTGLKEGQILNQILLKWIEKYGRTIVVFLFHKPMVATIDPQSVKDLLITGGHPKAKENYSLSFSLYGARFFGSGLATEVDHIKWRNRRRVMATAFHKKFFGNSLVTECDNEKWQSRRTLMNPAFHRKFLQNLMSEFNQTADDLMTHLLEKADGKTELSMLQHLTHFALDVIGKVAFGMDIDSIHNSDSPFPSAIHKTMEGLTTYIKSPIARNVWFMDRKFKQEVKDACKFLRETGKRCLDDRIAAMAWGEEVPEDILTYVVRTKETETSLTTEELLDDFTTFFIAGHETTATTLSFLLMEVGKRPKVWKRLQDEIDTVLGQKSCIEFEDLGKLEYCSWLFKETLRLYPPSTMTFRELTKNHPVAGYNVPQGTVIVLSTYISSRMPDFYDSPLDFRPERFDPKNEKIPNYTYFPFSVGPRNCIGQNFAQIEAKVLLAKFVQRFNIHLDMAQSFDIQETTTLRPIGGTKCTLTPRESNNNTCLFC